MRSGHPPVVLLGKLLQDNPGITVADLVTLCASQGIDLVLIPQDGSSPVELHADHGVLRIIQRTPSALDQVLNRR